MLKIAKSGLLVGLMLCACPGAWAQATARAPDRELLFGTGLSRLGFDYMDRLSPVLLPAILLKKPMGKAYRRYSLRLNVDSDREYKPAGVDSIPQRQTIKEFALTSMLGIGSEWRFQEEKKLMFYLAGEFVTIFHWDRFYSEVETEAGSNSPAMSTKGTSNYIVPGTGFNAYAGFRFEPHPRVSLSAEAGPGINALFRMRTNKGENVIAPDTPAQVIVLSKESDWDIKVNLGFFIPVFVAAGFKF